MFAAVCGVCGDFAQMLNVGEIEVFRFGDTEDFCSFSRVEEFTSFVEEFQCVPLFGIVACSEDDASTSLFAGYGKFGRRCCSKVDIEDIKTHAYQRA